MARAASLVSVSPIKPPPQSGASEAALIGALLLDCRSAWPQVADLIRPEHIHRNDHRIIFEAVAELMAESDTPPGAAVIVDQLSYKGELEAAGGTEYIAKLVEETLSSANVRSYALAVREAADRRHWVDVSNRLAQAAHKGSPEEAAEIANSALASYEISASVRHRLQPLELESMALWAERPEPPPRDWIVEGLIPAGRVTSLFGNGGLGKTLLAMQLGLHISMSRPLFGLDIAGGTVLGIFCEDEQAELERRGRAACAGENVALGDVDGFYPVSRDGLDSYLCLFENDRIQLTKFYHELEATIETLNPRLVILDTAADMFAGDFVSTPHVRQFIKIALGGLCLRYGCAILLLAHPSQSAMSTGDGGGFSTAWNNSVRSRLYLRRPKVQDADEAHDRRVLEVMKSNYASDGFKVALAYTDGYFVADPDPVDEAAAAEKRAKQAPTKLAFAVHTYLRNQGTIAVPFGDILDHLLTKGHLVREDKPATNRKKVQRALDQLARMELVKKCSMPRGTYRVLEDGTWDTP